MRTRIKNLPKETTFLELYLQVGGDADMVGNGHNKFACRSGGFDMIFPRRGGETVEGSWQVIVEGPDLNLQGLDHGPISGWAEIYPDWVSDPWVNYYPNQRVHAWWTEKGLLRLSGEVDVRSFGEEQKTETFSWEGTLLQAQESDFIGRLEPFLLKGP
jgi:hypothetical protein